MMCVLAVALVACSDDKKAPTTTAPAGFTVMSDADEGFALAVPSDWTAIPLSNNPAEFDQDANRLRAENPKLASILNQARVLGQSGGIFMAVTPDGTGSVNLTADKPKEKTLEEIVRASVTALEGIGASNIRRESSTLDGKPSMKVSLRVPVQTDAGEIPTDEVQHYLLEDGKAFILTVAAAPAPVGDAIAASLRIR
jgi:hypothetical protein